jgi:hypothetical protein
MLPFEATLRKVRYPSRWKKLKDYGESDVFLPTPGRNSEMVMIRPMSILAITNARIPGRLVDVELQR